MANLFYSEDDTLANAISANIIDATRFLSYASSNCAMQVPNDFSCLAFLKDLPGWISDLNQNINDIYNSVVNIDTAYRNLSDSMIEENHKLDIVNCITERERLIK